jgi:glycosyltransferase involved in cell wall biosynthesis
MKIIHLIDYFQPKIGYQETFLAKEMMKLGHDVCVVTSDRYYPLSNYSSIYQDLLGKRVVGRGKFIEDDIKTVRLKTIEIPNTTFCVLFGLKEVLDRFNPDLVFCHGVFSYISYLAAIYKKKYGYKLYYDSHAANFNTDFENNILKKIYYQLYRTFALKKIRSNADRIYAIGKEEKEFLFQYTKLNNTKIRILRLGVEINQFKPSQYIKKVVRKKLGWNHSDFVLIFAGKITTNKKVHILAKALAFLKIPQIKLLLVGDGDKKYIGQILGILNNAKVKYKHIKFVENKKLVNYYQTSDIGVWPGDPTITFLEAMSCGLPLILSKISETKYLQKSNAVFFINNDDITDLASKIKLTYKDKITRLKMRESARKFIITNLSWSKITQEIFQN